MSDKTQLALCILLILSMFHFALTVSVALGDTFEQYLQTSGDIILLCVSIDLVLLTVIMFFLWCLSYHYSVASDH
jgi:hypothetical protein